MSYLEGNDLSEQNMVSVPNPYVYQTLQSAIGKHVVIETVRGNVRGKLKDVKPDWLHRRPNKNTGFYLCVSSNFRF
ncbi:DUF2642 domain-containing protein [Bacillus mycoides]